MKEKKSFLIGPREENIRVDKLLATKLAGYSRARIQRLIEMGLVELSGNVIKGNVKGKVGDKLEIFLPPEEPLKVLPEAIPLEIVYEDDDLLIINKPQGLVVHPAAGNEQGTLVNALLHYYPPIKEVNDQLRPGIVHRLDKDTSGLMVVAKNDPSFKRLAEQLKAYQIKRRYLAIVHGSIAEAGGKIEAPIGRHPGDRKKMAVVNQRGRYALSQYWVKKRFEKYSYLEVGLHTGRTHQIRVHLAYIGHPILGDMVYGTKKKHLGIDTQMLHAFQLGFNHPVKGGWLEFTSPLPHKFQAVLNQLESG
ncbi:MAG: RluA family pseudouridine synthase [Bacillota bacterium]